jgi:DNA polymerase-3 subunit delta
LQGDAKRIVRVLQNLRTEGVEPTLLLWACSREIRTLIQIKQDLAMSTKWEAITRKHHIWEKRQPLVKKGLTAHTPKTLQLLLLQALKIDKIIKGLESGNCWNELQTLALRLSGGLLHS